MNIYVSVQDGDLMEQVRRIKGIETLYPIQDIKELHVKEPAFFLLSDKLVQANELPYLREKYPENKFIYLISHSDDKDKLDQVKTICQTQKIEYIMPFATLRDIITRIEELIFGREIRSTSVVGFMGGLPQTGLTSSILSIGTHMSKVTNAKIGILGLNSLNSGDDLVAYRGKTFDQLWGNLMAASMTADELIERSHLLGGNVYYLAGNKDFLKAPYFQVEGVRFLIEKAKEAFDLVLLDLGAFYDTPTAAQGLIQADLHVLAITQMITDIKAFQEKYDQILRLMDRTRKERMLLLHNQVRDLPGLYSPQEVSEMLGIPTWIKLPYESRFYHRILEKDPDSFLSKEYSLQIAKAAESLLNRYELPIIEQVDLVKKKSWGPKWLKRMVGVTSGEV